MESKGVRTCAGCAYNKKRLIKGCRISTEGKCSIGNNESYLKGVCGEMKPRFEIQDQVKKQMEVELL